MIAVILLQKQIDKKFKYSLSIRLLIGNKRAGQLNQNLLLVISIRCVQLYERDLINFYYRIMCLQLIRVYFIGDKDVSLIEIIVQRVYCFKELVPCMVNCTSDIEMLTLIGFHSEQVRLLGDEKGFFFNEMKSLRLVQFSLLSKIILDQNIEAFKFEY